MPSAVPVAYGLAGTPLSAFSAACGVAVYYMCDMIHGKMEPLLHAAEAPEITAVVQEFFNGLFRNEEMLLASKDVKEIRHNLLPAFSCYVPWAFNVKHAEKNLLVRLPMRLL